LYSADRRSKHDERTVKRPAVKCDELVILCHHIPKIHQDIAFSAADEFNLTVIAYPMFLCVGLVENFTMLGIGIQKAYRNDPGRQGIEIEFLERLGSLFVILGKTEKILLLHLVELLEREGKRFNVEHEPVHRWSVMRCVLVIV
jgi:hypothetical protein